MPKSFFGQIMTFNLIYSPNAADSLCLIGYILSQSIFFTLNTRWTLKYDSYFKYEIWNMKYELCYEANDINDLIEV